MAKAPSQASRFQSRFDGGFLAPAQYLAECMVDRQARQKSRRLPDKFWNDTRYKRDFLLQLRFANSLLKVYSLESVRAALQSKEGRRIYSLGAKWLDPLIKAEQERLCREKKLRDSQSQEPVAAAPVITNEKPRQAFATQPSLLNKLRSLD